MTEESWKPVPEAAKAADVPERTLYRWIRQKRLTTRQEGGVTLAEVGAASALATQRAASKGPATAGSSAGDGSGGGSGGTGARDPGELAAEVFAQFEAGISPIDVVQEMQLPPDRVAGLHRSWVSMKEAQRSGPTTAERLAAVERELKALREELDQRTRHGSLGGEVDGLQIQIAALIEHVKALPVPPREKFQCDCGATGWIAVPLVCTACGRQHEWGFHAPK